MYFLTLTVSFLIIILLSLSYEYAPQNVRYVWPYQIDTISKHRLHSRFYFLMSRSKSPDLENVRDNKPEFSNHGLTPQVLNPLRFIYRQDTTRRTLNTTNVIIYI
jgi:hypothetical protein